MTEENPTESTVIRAGQRPPMMLGVPLDVFLIECFLGFLLFAFLGIWAVAFLPVHLVPLIWTAGDLHWPKTKYADYQHWWFANNKHLKSKGAITFSAAPIRNKFKDHEQ
jgi:type IV secretory pathway VirB3-like protein